MFPNHNLSHHPPGGDSTLVSYYKEYVTLKVLKNKFKLVGRDIPQTVLFNYTTTQGRIIRDSTWGVVAIYLMSSRCHATVLITVRQFGKSWRAIQEAFGKMSNSDTVEAPPAYWCPKMKKKPKPKLAKKNHRGTFRRLNA